MNIRSSAHVTVQKHGKKRDLYTCQVCGSKECVEGHHILAYQFGGAADVQNIVTLCHRCHKQVHRGRMDVMKF